MLESVTGVVSAVVVVGAGFVVVGAGLAVVAGVGAVVEVGTPSPASDAVVVSVVEVFVRRTVVDVVDTSVAIGAVELTGVLLETVESVRARPKRKAPTATVTTRAAMSSVAMAWSTGLRLGTGRSLTSGVSPVGSSQLATGRGYPRAVRTNRGAVARHLQLSRHVRIMQRWPT